MRKIVNNRPLCFASAMLAVGIISEVFAWKWGSSAAKIVVAVFPLLLSVILLIFKKTGKFAYLPLFFCLGAVSFIITEQLYTKNFVNHSGTAHMTVASEIVERDGAFMFDASDIYIDGNKVNGKAAVRCLQPPSFNAGDTVTVEGSLLSKDFAPYDSYFASAYSRGITIFCQADGIEKYAENKPDFFLAVEMKLKRAFYENTKEDTASISIALIYGDKTAFNTELSNDIKLAGLAHVLAVSGMHISVLSGALYFLLKKLKIGKKFAAPILIVLLFAYSLFCGFSPSVTRAFIMASVFLILNALGLKSDAMSALSLSGIIILLINPLALFEIGFLLSFASVLGIFLFFRSFNLVFKKTGRVLSPIISTTLSANVTTFPVAAHYFSYIPVFSVLANIIILPVTAVVFILLLIFAVFVLIVPLPSVLALFDYLLLPFKTVVFFAGSLDALIIPVSSLGVMTIAYYFVCIVFSRFVFLKTRTKVVASSAVAAACLTAIGLINLFAV
jgi:competence protein ComEC